MIYVCGDSFNTVDQMFKGQSWYEKFSTLVTNVTNLSMVCASNLLISLQVNRAIEKQASYIIVGFTSVTRSEVTYDNQKTSDLLDRFYSLTEDNNDQCDLTTYSILAPDTAQALTFDQQNLLTKFNEEFFDLNLAIYRDHIIIEHTLYKLKNSGIPFLFDQGGFEHSSYGATKKYFTEYDQYRSLFNLWDHANIRTHRPYFHIVDPNITDQIAQYYYSKIL